MNKEQLFDVKEAAAYLTSKGLKSGKAKLDRWRTEPGNGPEFLRITGKIRYTIRYTKGQLDEFLTGSNPRKKAVDFFKFPDPKRQALLEQQIRRITQLSEEEVEIELRKVER